MVIERWRLEPVGSGLNLWYRSGSRLLVYPVGCAVPQLRTLGLIASAASSRSWLPTGQRRGRHESEIKVIKTVSWIASQY